MWKRIVDTGKRIFSSLINFLSRSNYNKTIINSILKWFPYIIGSIITAIVAVLYSKIFDYSVSVSKLVKHNFPWLFFIITPVCLLAGWWIVKKISPAASGSGIPQLMAAVNPKRNALKVSTGYLLGGKVLVTKVLSSIVALLGGALIGREGPTIQISGSVFYITHKFLPDNWPKVDRERMLIAGGAAGLAAAFNTPLGGIVFAIEELSRSNLNAFKSTLLYAVIFSGMTVQWILGPYLFLGFPKVEAGGFSLIGYVIIFSAIAGIAGALKGKFILELLKFTKRFKKTYLHVIYILISGLVVAFFIYSNKNVAYGPGKDVMNQLLFDTKDHDASVWLLISRFFGAIISYATGIAGGIFATSLSTGSILGHLLMNLFSLDSNNKLLILVTMIGLLTGVTRAPFTSSILVLEMTDRHAAIFFFILAGLIASVTARLIDRRPLYKRLEESYLG
jgi:H+/Cl- antiporter ClcA